MYPSTEVGLDVSRRSGDAGDLVEEFVLRVFLTIA
jgi:hypothetical protein